LSLPFFIARKLRADSGSKDRVSKPVVRIAAAGVALGLAVMIVSVSVVVGFKHTVRDLVVGFAGNIQVAEFSTMQTSEQRPVEMTDSMMRLLRSIKGVERVERYAHKEGILKTDSDFLGVVLKGLGQEFDTAFIASHLVAGHLPNFSNPDDANSIAISKSIADRLHLEAGKSVFAYFIDSDGVRMRRFTIAGIYQTNLAMYDKTMCLAQLRTVTKLNGWDSQMVTGVELWTGGEEQEQSVAEELVRRVNRTQDNFGNTYTSKTTHEINPQIFSWLDLLDLNVWIILAIMTIVAAVTMISGILIIILERTQMIGTLKALGARNATIRRTFLLYASFIIVRGLLWGNGLGIGIVLLQQFTGIVRLDPTIYYVAYVPVELNILAVIALNIGTLLVSIVAIIAPSFIVSAVNPARSMRYE